jgi:hypothetical protein
LEDLDNSISDSVAGLGFGIRGAAEAVISIAVKLSQKIKVRTNPQLCPHVGTCRSKLRAKV